MKFFRTITAVTALVMATMTISSSALAEPSKDTEHYYVLGQTRTTLILLADQKETISPTKHNAWFLGYLSRPEETVEGAIVQGFWVLTQFDCKAKTVKPLRIERIDANLNTISSESPPIRPEKPSEGSPIDVALDTICETDNRAPYLTAQETVELMMAFAA